MRLWEFYKKDETIDETKGSVLDVISALRAQKIDRITVDRVIKTISKNPELAGINITPDLIGQAIESIDDVKMEPDSDRPGNPLTLFIKPSSAINNGGKPEDSKQAVEKSADKQLQREL